jgi:Bacteriophage baseplate protein W
VSEEFIGSGWGFPVRTDAIGGIALVSREREIEESIRLILGTAVGERPMRPEFGCRVHEHVFAPADATTAGLIAYEVRQSLLRWEPRIDVTDVAVEPDPDDPSTLYITVEYTIPRTNDPRNLVFPFYTIPPETPVVAVEGSAAEEE